MKIFFDTNVSVAEALLGQAASAIISATEAAGRRIFCSEYVLDEVVRVLAVQADSCDSVADAVSED